MSESSLISFHEWSLNNNNTESKVSNLSNSSSIPDIYFHAIKYTDKSLFVWIGDADRKMDTLSCAMQTTVERDPIGTEILQSQKIEQEGLFSNLSKDLAIRLAKKLKKQVFVSFNVGHNLLEPIASPTSNNQSDQLDFEPESTLLKLIETALFQEIKFKPENF